MGQLRAEETRRKIIAASFECFCKEGYAGASVASVCNEAGVTKGAFYHHFPSKQALFLELLNEWLTALDGLLNDARSNASSVPEALRLMAGKTTLIIAGSKERLPMFLEFWNQALRDPIVWRLTIAPYRRYSQYFSDLIARGIAEGSIIKSLDADTVGRAIVSLAVGLILQSMMDPDVPNWEQKVYDALITFFNGIETKSIVGL